MKYPIRAVSKLTGVAIDTLRAWERRYGAVTPARDARGRMYSDADVVRLRLLHQAVSQGHAIGRVAALSDAELRRATQPAPAAAPSTRARSIDTRVLQDAIAGFDASTVDTEIGRFAATLAPDVLLRDVVIPLLTGVGDAWHEQRATAAHEHLISAAFRNVLGSLLRVYSPARRRSDAHPCLLFATPSGERHELGTLGAAMLAAAAGLDVVYLGPDLPGRDIADSASRARARVVVLGVTRTTDRQTTAAQLKIIARHLAGDVELWIGGASASHYAETIRNRARILDGYNAFASELARIAGRPLALDGS
jgi:DNA-binding transcriptional MerR regulator/methylmalonyl-CoA mutase cobalamin-binding subunit